MQASRSQESRANVMISDEGASVSSRPTQTKESENSQTPPIGCGCGHICNVNVYTCMY